MPLEVLNEHLVHAVRCRWVAAGISHRASTAVEILPHYHRNFPQSWIGSRGTGRYHAVVEEFVIQCIRPAGRPVLIDRHRGVIREVCLPEHFEHVVAADLCVSVAKYIQNYPLLLELHHSLSCIFEINSSCQTDPKTIAFIFMYFINYFIIYFRYYSSAYNFC